MNTQTLAAARPFTFHSARQKIFLLLVLLSSLLILNLGQANAQNTAPNTTILNQTDAKVSVFCGYIKALPQSKWVGAIGLVFAIIGGIAIIVGGRGGLNWLIRGLGLVMLVPGIVGISAGFGIGC